MEDNDWPLKVRLAPFFLLILPSPAWAGTWPQRGKVITGWGTCFSQIQSPDNFPFTKLHLELLVSFKCKRSDFYPPLIRVHQSKGGYTYVQSIYTCPSSNSNHFYSGHFSCLLLEQKHTQIHSYVQAHTWRQSQVGHLDVYVSYPKQCLAHD